MHLTFLGTGAATAVPLPFCTCPTCRAARVRGGRDRRRRSSLLIGGALLIDLGPDTVQALLDCGKDLTAVQALLVTHAHSDHFDPGHFVTRLADYACKEPAPLLLSCSETGLRRLSDSMEREEADTRVDTESGRARLRVRIHPNVPGEAFDAAGCRITPLYSRHDPAVDSRLYVVDDGQKRVLYATDTPAPGPDFYEALAALGKPLDCAIFDHTYGPDLPDSGTAAPRPDHMSAHDVARAARTLRERGLLAPDGPVYATHISHEGTPLFEELDAFARANGYRIAFDGLELDI